MADATRIPDSVTLPELTLRGVLLGALITVIFTASNVFLGLKVGLTFSSAIPAAVISMSVLRMFRDANILENNMVQTQASAAGTLSAIIFILPALVMMGHWQGFPFWQTLAICGAGGMLGVMFTIPLRHIMVVQSDLPYPEGVAAAEILRVGSAEAPDTAPGRRGASGMGDILAGGGVIMANASEVLCELAHELNIPVATTLMGLGAFPANGDLWLGMVGMHGTYAANMSINHADLLVCVGARFDDRVTGRLQDFASHARIVHIDIDPTSIRKNVEVDVPVVGDCRQALEGILEICRAKMADTDWSGMHADWLETVHEWKANHPLAYNKNGHIKPQQVIETMYSITKGDAIIATEVGQNQMWAAQFYTFTKPRTLLTSGGLGTMGYGFPAAIGAQFAFPDKLVINVAGDGSIQMNIQELATVVQNKIPVKVVILNNGHLGMVRQWQELFYNRNYSHTNMEAQPDFVKLAEAYGAEGYRISKPEELEDVLRKALTSPNPAFIDVMVEREENVYPMVPAGAALDEMLLV